MGVAVGDYDNDGWSGSIPDDPARRAAVSQRGQRSGGRAFVDVTGRPGFALAVGHELRLGRLLTAMAGWTCSSATTASGRRPEPDLPGPRRPPAYVRRASLSAGNHPAALPQPGRRHASRT